MRYVKCPDILFHGFNEFTLFMAGGITGCPDWQESFKALLSDEGSLVLVNPRREMFDITDPTMSDQQIKWEHIHLEQCQGVSFWFPEETLCPITLYELGKIAMSNKVMFVGTHPNYKRRFDVIKQLQLVRPEIKVTDNLVDLAKTVSNYLRR